jgi:hypothetical protein
MSEVLKSTQINLIDNLLQCHGAHQYKWELSSTRLALDMQIRNWRKDSKEHGSLPVSINCFFSFTLEHIGCQCTGGPTCGKCYSDPGRADSDSGLCGRLARGPAAVGRCRAGRAREWPRTGRRSGRLEPAAAAGRAPAGSLSQCLAVPAGSPGRPRPPSWRQLGLLPLTELAACQCGLPVALPGAATGSRRQLPATMTWRRPRPQLARALGPGPAAVTVTGGLTAGLCRGKCRRAGGGRGDHP